MIKPEYLGDGVYASFDGYHVWLTTGSHEERDASNRIALEPAVFAALVRYHAGLAAAEREAEEPDSERTRRADHERDEAKDPRNR